MSGEDEEEEEDETERPGKRKCMSTPFNLHTPTCMICCIQLIVHRILYVDVHVCYTSCLMLS